MNKDKIDNFQGISISSLIIIISSSVLILEMVPRRRVEKIENTSGKKNMKMKKKYWKKKVGF